MLHRVPSKLLPNSATFKPSKSKPKKKSSLSSMKSKSPYKQVSSLKQTTNLKKIKSKNKGVEKALNQLKKEVPSHQHQIYDMKEEVSRIKSQCSICSPFERKTNLASNKSNILQEKDLNQMKSVLDIKSNDSCESVNLECSEEMESKLKISEEYLFCQRNCQNKENQSFAMNISEPLRKRLNQQAQYYTDYYLQH